jgi:hypothetical protein
MKQRTPLFSIKKFIFLTKLLLILSLFLLIFKLCLPYTGSTDIFHHLKTGEIILKNKKVPHQDIFSFGETKYWVNHQWLTQLIFYIIFSKFGWLGLLILKAVITIITFTILLIICLETSKNFFLSLIILILSISTAYIGIELRAQIFTYLFLIVLYYLIYIYHHKNKNYPLLIIPFLMWIWLNFHGAFFIGYIFMFIFLFGEFVKNVFPKFLYNFSLHCLPKIKIYYLIITIFISLLLGLINPNYYHIYTFPFTPLFNKDIYQITIEWSPPNLLNPLNYFYDLMLIITIIVFILSIKRVDFTTLILAISFIYFSLSSWRFIPIFAIIITPSLTENINNLLNLNKFFDYKKTFKTFKIIYLNFILLFSLIIIIHSFSYSYKYIRDKTWEIVISSQMPIGGINFLKRNYISGNMFTTYNTGAYCIFELYPRYKVGIDMRFDTVYTVEYIRKYQITIEGKEGWENFLREYNINSIFISNSTPLVRKLNKSNNWKIAYMDEKYVIFVRNIFANRKFIENYQKIEKYFNEAKEFIRDEKYDGAIAILNKILNIEPENVSVYNFLGIIYAEKNEISIAISYWNKAIEINPAYTPSRINLGFMYGSIGMKDKARKEFMKALEIEPNNEMIKKLLGRLR